MREISLITGKLESAGIPYCLVGGLAAIAYGRPRLTLDAGSVPDQALLLQWIDELSLKKEWEMVTGER